MSQPATEQPTITADEYAELLRAHTRAIWALKGELEYPGPERSAMGVKAQGVLAREDHGQARDLTITERGYTFKDMRLASMFARLEGAPATVEEIIRDLDAQGKLSRVCAGCGVPEGGKHDQWCEEQR